MKMNLAISALVTCALLLGCSKESTTIILSENSSQLQQPTEQPIAIRPGEALLNQQFLSGNFNSIIQQGKKPSAESVDYYSVKETTLPDQTKKLVVSAIFLNISESSAQDFFKRSNNVSEVVIVAEKIIISTELKFPGAKIIINASELSFGLNGSIITTPKDNTVFPSYGENGNPGKNAGDIILNVKKLNLGEKLVRFELNGGKGQQAGLGKNGAPGINISPLYDNVIKECTTTTSVCTDREAGEIAETPITTCRGSDRVPTNGADSLEPGAPGMGGNGGTLYLATTINTGEYLENKAGLLGDIAPLVKGGEAGTPKNAVVRNIQNKNVRGTCKSSKNSPKVVMRLSDDQSVVVTTSNGKNSTQKNLNSTSLSGNFLELKDVANDEKQSMFTLGDLRGMRLEYAKDLYRNNFFSEAREALNKAIENMPAKLTNLSDSIIFDEANLLLNQLNSNKDFYSFELTMAPVISLEATMTIYKSNIRTSMNTIALVASTRNTILTAKEKIDILLEQKNQLQNQMEIAYKNHETAYRMIPNLELKIVDLDHSKQELEESLQKVESQITAEANSNIHSTEKKKKLLGSLKLIATLASVSPLGAPAAQIIGSSLNTIIDLSQKKDNNWQDTLKEGYGIYSNLKKTDWHTSHESWNSIYSSLDKEVFLSNNKIEKRRTLAYLEHLYKTTKPLTDEIKKYYDETLSKKVPSNQYEAEVERIKSIHPLFKELVGKLTDVQQKKTELEIILSQVNNTIITSESEIIRDFAMINSVETQEENFVDGLDFSIDQALTKMDKDARNRLLKYKGALIKAYQYRTLMPFPGNLDLENLNRSITTFANKGEKAPSVETLINVYENDIAIIGQSLFDYIQNGNFKEYENEYSLELNNIELKALTEGKTVYLDLSKELDLFNDKENVRIISIEMDNFKADSSNAKNADFVVTHLGNSVLTKNGLDYIFNHLGESNPVTWISRLDLNSNSSTLIKESSSNASLLMAIMGRDAADGALLFNRIGAKAIFAITLKNTQKSIINQGSLKINYTYSL